MKNYLLFVGLALSLLACQSQPTADAEESEAVETPTTVELPAEPEYLIVVGQSLGPIGKGSTLAALHAALERNIIDTDFYLGEGYSEPGITIYPSSTKAIDVLLAEGEPTLAEIRHPESPWKTMDGIGIGSTLAEVQAANGAPFELAGFEWDYGGRVTDWGEGKFAAKDFFMTFDLEMPEKAAAEDMSQFLGDQIFASDIEALNNYKITVVAISQGLR